MKPVYVTGNPEKGKRFSLMLGIKLDSIAVDIDEIQSLDVRAIIEHKVKSAYEQLQRPVIVEDTTLSFVALGALPGPLIKWFLEELRPEGLCRLIDGKQREAVAGSAIAYFDGVALEIFVRETVGEVALEPRGSNGWGWDPVFIEQGSNKTNAELSDKEYEAMYKRVKPFDELARYLKDVM